MGGCYAANIEVTGKWWVPAPDQCSVMDVLVRVSKEHTSHSEAFATQAAGVVKSRRSGQNHGT